MSCHRRTTSAALRDRRRANSSHQPKPLRNKSPPRSTLRSTESGTSSIDLLVCCGSEGRSSSSRHLDLNAAVFHLAAVPFQADGACLMESQGGFEQFAVTGTAGHTPLHDDL